MRVLLALLVALSLAACDGSTRPFEHDGAADTRLAAPPEGLSVLVEPVAGLRDGLAVAASLAAALRAAEVPASTDFGADAGYRLFGAPDEGAVVWRLTRSDGRQVAGARTPATSAGPRIPEPGFHAAAAELARAIRADQTADMPGGPPDAGPPRLYLAEATGAPGDGARALPLAMRNALGDTRLELIEAAAPAAFTLQPEVRLGPAAGDMQPIEIVWVLRRDGEEIGRLAQRNAVPAGSLDERWGGTAVLAARAAAPGVSELIAEALR